jgi:hypothetical protein
MSDYPERRNGFINPSVKYEPTDLSLRAVLGFSGVLVLVLIAVSVGLYFVIPLVVGPTPKPRPLSAWNFGPERGPDPDASHLPSKPELEAVDENRPPTEGGRTRTRPIREQVQDEEARLNSYGKDENGVIHIPIEEAMKRMAGEGGKP